jgi:hypothetical protein
MANRKKHIVAGALTGGICGGVAFGILPEYYLRQYD